MTKLKIHLCLCESSKFSEFVVVWNIWFFKQINAKTIDILWVQVRRNFGFILDPLSDVQLLIRRKRCRSYAYIYFRKLLEVPGIPSHPGRLASSIVGRQQQGPLGDAYFSGMCSLGLC